MNPTLNHIVERHEMWESAIVRIIKWRARLNEKEIGGATRSRLPPPGSDWPQLSVSSSPTKSSFSVAEPRFRLLTTCDPSRVASLSDQLAGPSVLRAGRTRARAKGLSSGFLAALLRVAALRRLSGGRGLDPPRARLPHPRLAGSPPRPQPLHYRPPEDGAPLFRRRRRAVL